MIRTLLIFCLGCALGLPASAQQTFRVRAGEHGTHSRLVIPMPSDLAWEFTTSGRSAELVVPDTNATFSYDDVFDRIPKTRILALKSQTSPGESRLTLSLGCACNVVADISGQYLVIDVRDAEESESEGIAASDDVAKAPPARPTDPKGANVAAAPSASVAGNSVGRPPERPAAQTRNAPQAANEDAASDPQGAGEAPPDADEVTNRLISQLQRAAQQGLVDLNEAPEPADPEPPKTPKPEPEPEASPPGLEPSIADADGLADLGERMARALAELDQPSLGGGVKVHVPEERPRPSGRRGSRTQPLAEEEVDPHANCPEDYMFDLGVYNPSRPAAAQLIEMRSALLGEFDKPNIQNTFELARFYIAVGMGVEARALLVEFGDESDVTALLKDLSDIVDGRPLAADGHLATVAGCPGRAALWRTAGISTGETQPVNNPEDIIAELAELPISLRRRVGPKLVESFRTRGQIDAARDAFAVLDRAPGHHGSAHDFERGALLRLEGDTRTAEAIFLQLSASSTPMAAKAAIALVDSMLDRSVAVPDRLIHDLESKAYIYRDDIIGRSLRMAEIRAKSGTGHFAAALATVASEVARVPDSASAYMTAADEIFRTQDFSTDGAGKFAETVFKHMDILMAEEISQTGRNHVADHLADVGLPDAALILLEPGLSTKDPTSALIAADAHFALDRVEDTLEILDEIPQETADLLRARSLARLGMHQQALNAAETGAFSGDHPEFAWRAGNWEAAGRMQNPELRAMADFMRHREQEDITRYDPDAPPGDDLAVFPAPPPDLNEKPLAGATGLQSQSAAIRRVIQTAIEAQNGEITDTDFNR